MHFAAMQVERHIVDRHQPAKAAGEATRAEHAFIKLRWRGASLSLIAAAISDVPVGKRRLEKGCDMADEVVDADPPSLALAAVP